jgi:alpha-N-arabinofuranosidase
MEWDRTVLEYLGDLADYISLHRYVGNRTDDTPDFLAVGASIDQQIEEMDAVCRYVQAVRCSKKRAYLCFDEWNVWYKDRMGDGQGQFAPHLIEEVYNLEDALVVAEFLNSFVRHADSCKIANIAQIVNVIAPLSTRDDELLVHPTFYPFEMFSKRREGVALRVAVDGPTYVGATNGQVNVIDSSAVLNAGAGDGVLHVFAVNRSLDELATVQIELADGAIAALESGELLCGTDPKAVNTFEQPDLVRSQPLEGARVVGGKAQVELPPLAVAAMTFSI